MWRANSCLMAMCPPPLVGSFPQETNTASLLCKETHALASSASFVSIFGICLRVSLLFLKRTDMESLNNQLYIIWLERISPK